MEGNPKVTAIDKDGNVWVGTQSEQTTVFWPYPEGASSDDEIAVVRFPTLTRDYTIDQDPEELDAAIAACQPEALAIQKTETGVLFEVPSCGFGPFELMWLTDASGESGNVLEEKQAMAQTVSSMMDPKINLAAVMQQLKKRLLVAEIKQEVPFPKRAIR